MVWSSDEKKLTTQAYEVVNNKHHNDEPYDDDGISSFI